ncbi:amino acid adenylation domain-containing protein, partial [Kitasatospora sp. NPDC058965]|uniref:amino acid adenylation domain-containing protein n=1 Tax=Kitasatospora sp. NPDC058965 TaxID=3346682 RepID=UPI00369D2D7A
MIPLSFAQQRLWFLNRLEGATATYNIPIGLRLTGPLDTAALTAALHDLALRHESLRTVFPEQDGAPYQRVLAEPGREMLTVRPLTPRDQLDEELAAAARHAFDLTDEVPLHAWLFELGPQERVLLLVLHHIAADGWSLAPLTRDLAAAYTARLAGRSPEWAALPVQYADYTLWQRELLGDEDDPQSLVSQQLDHWRATLAGLPSELALPVDRARPTVATGCGGRLPFQLDPAVFARITALAKEEGATVFMVVQAAIATLLCRLGAGTDIPLGTPVAGRTDVALDDLIGFFVNTLVLRTDLTGNPSFRELLQRVKATDLAAFAHQDVPFERLVEVLNPERSMNRHPLFQVMVTFDDGAVAAGIELPGITATALETTGERAKFDLGFGFSDQDGQGLGCSLEFSSDLFEPATAEALVRRFALLLDTLTEHPDQPIGTAALLDADELAVVDRPVPGVAAHEWDGRLLHRIFEQRAAETPDAVAVTSGSNELTYRQVNEQANRLAHRLRDLGVGAESLVGVCLDRDLDLVPTLIGVLKAGGAYVPLDPTYPADRLEYIATDAALTALVTQRAHRGLADAIFDGPVLAVEDLGTEPVTDLAAVTTDENAVYVIYTSGSTGRPKGCTLTHRNVVRLFTATDEYFGFGEQDVWALFFSYAFDFSVWEFWGALLFGGRLVMVPHDTARSPEELHRLLVEEQVTVLNQTPSAFRSLAQLPTEQLALRTVVFGGEKLEIADLGTWTGLDHLALVNMYGITETTVHVTHHRITDEDLTHPTVSPIGTPMPDLGIHLLDPHGQLVPLGVVGEIHVSGPGLARGYLGRPDLTAEKFVPNPYGPPGTRLYRSGDLARRNPDGTLESVGRADDQVKIRGYRIELGEIQNTLATHPDIAEAIVLVREDTPGDRRLVGYYVPVGDGPSTGELRAHLGRSLPEYMVPSALVALPAIPLTGNGKTDKRALPAPAVERTAGRAAATEAERVLCDLFAEVLGLPGVGVEENFFTLGGHSLLVTKLVSRIRSAFAAELPVRAVFEAPTPAALAEHIPTAEAGRAQLGEAERSTVVPLSYAQQRLWFLNRFEERREAYNVPICLRLAGPLDSAALTAALGDLVRRHESLRTVFPERDGVPHQLVRAEIGTVTTVGELTEAELPAAVAEAARTVFDLTTELPVRGWLYRLGPEDHALCLVLHHIAADGWSMAPLGRDLAAAYAARLAGEAPDWAELPVQYADYTLWQRELLGDESDPQSLAAAQLDFWRHTLAELPPELQLPTDHPRPAVPSDRGGRVKFALAPEVYQQLTAVARECGATVFMVLQAAVAALLSRLGAGTDIPFGTPIAGRTDMALDDLVGFFVNTLVLRTDLSGNPSFRELVARARETDLAAFAQQDLPFERLVEVLNPERAINRHPLFQVMLSFDEGTAGPGFALPGLTATELLPPTETAKFDLAFSFTDRAGSVEYATDLFDRESVELLAARLQRLLGAVAGDPGLRLADLELLSEAEGARILGEWNATARPGAGPTFPELFEQQVRATPQAVAVVAADGELSYAELNRRANRLARELLARGAGPERCVALALPRTTDLVVAQLAVWKAGAAYLPLDP